MAARSSSRCRPARSAARPVLTSAPRRWPPICKGHGKTKSKVLILDANDSFSKKGLFEQAWKTRSVLAGDMIEWVPGASDGKVVKVDAKTKTAYTNFGEHKADVLNIIPPHTAGSIAKDTGLTNDKGWC